MTRVDGTRESGKDERTEGSLKGKTDKRCSMEDERTEGRGREERVGPKDSGKKEVP